MDETRQRCRACALDQQQWSEALARYRLAEVGYVPIRAVFERAERTYFALRREQGNVSDADDERLARATQMAEATADEQRYGRTRYAALRALLCTPAPDLAAVVCKLDLIRDTDWDEDVDPVILADLRRLQGRSCDAEQR